MKEGIVFTIQATRAQVSSRGVHFMEAGSFDNCVIDRKSGDAFKVINKIANWEEYRQCSTSLDVLHEVMAGSNAEYDSYMSQGRNLHEASIMVAVHPDLEPIFKVVMNGKISDLEHKISTSKKETKDAESRLSDLSDRVSVFVKMPWYKRVLAAIRKEI